MINFALTGKSKMELIFATNNKHKIREISLLLETGTKFAGLADVNITEDIPEDAENS